MVYEAFEEIRWPAIHAALSRVDRGVSVIRNVEELRARQMAQPTLASWLRAGQLQTAVEGSALSMTKGVRPLGAAGAGFLLVQDVKSLLQSWKHLEGGGKGRDRRGTEDSHPAAGAGAEPAHPALQADPPGAGLAGEPVPKSGGRKGYKRCVLTVCLPARCTPWEGRGVPPASGSARLTAVLFTPVPRWAASSRASLEGGFTLGLRGGLETAGPGACPSSPPYVLIGLLLRETPRGTGLRMVGVKATPEGQRQEGGPARSKAVSRVPGAEGTVRECFLLPFWGVGGWGGVRGGRDRDDLQLSCRLGSSLIGNLAR
ncbi:hypothetical protein GH733_017631 [Mirounga leonina]|nr:hypothetical protein GH733_017631 [Mirounga leonina]